MKTSKPNNKPPRRKAGARTSVSGEKSARRELDRFLTALDSDASLFTLQAGARKALARELAGFLSATVRGLKPGAAGLRTFFGGLRAVEQGLQELRSMAVRGMGLRPELSPFAARLAAATLNAWADELTDSATKPQRRTALELVIKQSHLAVARAAKGYTGTEETFLHGRLLEAIETTAGTTAGLDLGNEKNAFQVVDRVALRYGVFDPAQATRIMSESGREKLWPLVLRAVHACNNRGGSHQQRAAKKKADAFEDLFAALGTPKTYESIRSGQRRARARARKNGA
jgi:hypothetical protein